MRSTDPLVTLEGIDGLFPADMDLDLKAKARTLFYKKLSLAAHRDSGGVMQTLPKTGVYGFNWFNVLYSPGVSAVSTAIRSDPGLSFELSSRGTTVAVVSDSTRVLGDGDCGAPGGLGVMEGKAFLMKYLGGVDAVPLCIDSRGEDGAHDPDRIIDFVRMVQHSFGAVNLEDISQPNCFKVLDELQDCEIPVWHDDAQGTACVTVAGLFNALKLAGKELGKAKIAMMGAGAANSSIARLLVAAGADPERMVIFDERGSLHAGREDYRADARYYRQWDLCRATNPKRVQAIEDAFAGADVLVALSAPGPDTVRPAWIRAMAPKAIVFACANPVPEIWPHAAKEAGAFIVATGRGDFANQVNNSVCFPGLLKGVLLARAKAVSDGMTLRCARALAGFAERKGLSPDAIMPTMDDGEVFAIEASEVLDQARIEGLARSSLTAPEALARAKADIAASRASYRALMDSGCIAQPDPRTIRRAFDEAMREVGA